MSAAYLQTSHSSLQTPFWKSSEIPSNLKFAVSQAFPKDDVPDSSKTANYDETSQKSKVSAVKELLVDVVETREKTLEPTDELQYRALHALAMTCAELGQWAEAEVAYKKLIALSDKNFGPNSKYAMGGISNLGKVYEHLGKYEDAEEGFRKSMLQLESSLGKDSPQYLGALRGLIEILLLERKYAEAEDTLKQGLEIVGKMSGSFKDEETDEMNVVAEKVKVAKK